MYGLRLSPNGGRLTVVVDLLGLVVVELLVLVVDLPVAVDLSVVLDLLVVVVDVVRSAGSRGEGVLEAVVAVVLVTVCEGSSGSSVHRVLSVHQYQLLFSSYIYLTIELFNC